MNTILQKEIISHIFGLIGLKTGNQQSLQRQFINLSDNKFLSNQKFIIETDDHQRYERKIWAASGQINTSKIKLLLADISDDALEYLLLIKLDDLDASALYFSTTMEDNGTIYFSFNNNWGVADTLLQSKLLTGTEQLTALFIDWKKLEDIEDLYKLLPGLLDTIFP